MPREQAATLLAAMAPDEASEALREMDEEDRDEVLEEMGHLVRNELAMLLAYDEDTAGSMMTSVMVVVSLNTTVEQAIAKLGSFVEDRGDIDGVLIVDDSGRLIDDVSLFELLLAAEGGTADAAKLREATSAAIVAAVKDQADAGVDVIGDGEMGKVSYTHYVRHRLGGVEPATPAFVPLTEVLR